MGAVAGLLVMLLGVCHGVETHCDGRQDGAQCYGALGGTVDIQLMDSSSEIPRYQMTKDSLKILDVRNNNVIVNAIKHRSLFPSKGIFRINKLSRNDSGKYTLQAFDLDGTITGSWTLQLFIQAPVSSVLLLSGCLSQGEMRVSCSSEGGDSPQYSWTLDGRTLTDAELLSENNEGNIITLKQHVSGDLVCSVGNNVSKVSKEERISTCGFIFINCTSVNGTKISGWVHEVNNSLCIKPTHTGIVNADAPWYISNLPLIAGVFSALIIFSVVGVAVVCAQRKKENSKRTRKEGEDDQEEISADVSDMRQQAKKLERRPEVEYGQVKSVKRHRKTEPTGDDCLYANINKVR